MVQSQSQAHKPNPLLREDHFKGLGNAPGTSHEQLDLQEPERLH
jgi:hypothetical protein